MGAKWLFLWEPVDNAVDKNVIFNDICSRCMVFVRAVKEDYIETSTFSFVEPIISEHSQEAIVKRYKCMISLAEEPEQIYLIQREDGVVVQNNMLSQRLLRRYDFEMFRYHQDSKLQFRVGKVYHNNSDAVLTVFIEMDYLDQFSIIGTSERMQYYIETWNRVAVEQKWKGKFVHVDRRYGDYGLCDSYSPRHTVIQYYAVMKGLNLGTKWVFVWKPEENSSVDCNRILNEIHGVAESVPNAIIRETRWGATISIVDLPNLMNLLGLSGELVFGILLEEDPSAVYMLQPPPNKERWMINFPKVAQILMLEGFSLLHTSDEVLVRVGRVKDASGMPHSLVLEEVFINDFSIQGTSQRMETIISNLNKVAKEKSWMGQFVEIEPGYAEFGLPDDYYTPHHSAQQYYALMAHLAS